MKVKTAIRAGKGPKCGAEPTRGECVDCCVKKHAGEANVGDLCQAGCGRYYGGCSKNI